ncbi:2-amino-4-hydroxy-6-hydroxymethyldihydropteridine diphosphokinase [Acinetobacter tandoii]|uniref:2-amino-4-hydroxy-6-hydroxymethyldihydropteridine diphosphokinase n=1 Tax=Acinetobacter tandoii DSM 14970 = CIP 107469 TaxID=1120927 RepID=R9B1Z5_9GAMM|nr:2-amino-4-hydroxy-6-hydroxymethyldihydropteridine diphosphokinase [Acinetobacter tandoii]EOR08529.1 2-amino-4-hydroxy-6-hydroxymethyldihydropteridine diphosphokinase [Acinetobacter tandoii DSM 14970 = CIP 107469]
MNATETIYALALASNLNSQHNFRYAYHQICGLGVVEFSKIYVIPCRDGVGADYWNAACLLHSKLNPEQIIAQLKQWEADTGRVRPSHQISLDVDLIAWGMSLEQMQFNPKKMPLALDVKIPMVDVWSHPSFEDSKHEFPTIKCLEVINT